MINQPECMNKRVLPTIIVRATWKKKEAEIFSHRMDLIIEKIWILCKEEPLSFKCI